ncbi:hypothetical protein DACRYDRAFT_116194 [Dacryopinax primogenitus]|uniref:Uncharacterized protein n=1 Tax=Dacryopinax primogenitus (strain DJM 731) TaxID=1858805 RepID=M5FV99_DACPD|nr:uncharacterized protein DACRYDRAFT_116194 [Dacryopinax primogenitus]EJU01706.1 hypothetical protein DACRYDRAFT_116194 [Dacryopinax primogenitus]
MPTHPLIGHCKLRHCFMEQPAVDMLTSLSPFAHTTAAHELRLHHLPVIFIPVPSPRQPTSRLASQTSQRKQRIGGLPTPFTSTTSTTVVRLNLDTCHRRTARQSTRIQQSSEISWLPICFSSEQLVVGRAWHTIVQGYKSKTVAQLQDVSIDEAKGERHLTRLSKRLITSSSTPSTGSPSPARWRHRPPPGRRTRGRFATTFTYAGGASIGGRR